MGTLSSSRLTKILQEKAELLKRQRLAAEKVMKEVDGRLRQLETIGLSIPELKEKESQLKELARKSDWEAAETAARTLLDLTESASAPLLEGRRVAILGRFDGLAAQASAGIEALRATADEVRRPSDGEPWARRLERLAELDRSLKAVEQEFGQTLRKEAQTLADWAELPSEKRAGLDAKLRTALEPLKEGKVGEALDRLSATLSTEIAPAVERRARAREAGEALVAAARDLGVPAGPLESALAADPDSRPLEWPTSVAEVEGASAQLTDALRERVGSTIESLGRTLESLREFGADPTENLVTIQECSGQLKDAGPAALPKLLQRARDATEEPVVTIVASLLDEVRPRIVEARRLGRDPSDVFAAMNRAREALRLKIYSEALAASQEAVERIGRLTGDLDAARDEATSLKALLGRLRRSRFPATSFEDALTRAQSHLDRVELDAARALLDETVAQLGREAVTHFSKQREDVERIVSIAREREFVPPDVDRELTEVGRLLDDGKLAEVGEALAQLEVDLRIAAGPYVSRRVEMLEKGFSEIPDETLIAPVRRLLADADVNLRVKEDLAGSLEALKRAEREFAAVFAAHASSLVEALDEERRVLESMGGTGDEIQRQIDEVQQIFNMGDFVKASRASQEIRTRLQQQQLVRSEESVSHAKLALVELGKMGLDAAGLGANLERAQQELQQRRFKDAYNRAAEVESSAGKLKGSAQTIRDDIDELTASLQELKRGGAATDGVREELARAKKMYQELDFDSASRVTAGVRDRLAKERATLAVNRLRTEIDLLLEDARRLDILPEPFEHRRDAAVERLESGDANGALNDIEMTHRELVRELRPVLEEHVRSVELDLEVARSNALEIPAVVETLAEARRRLTTPLPVGVAALLDTAHAQLVESKGFLEHAERALRRAREAVAQAELVRVPLHGQKAQLEKAEARLAGREYARVIDLATALEREVLQATTQHVSRTLASFQATVTRSKQAGIPTTVAENLLHQARNALQDGRPLEALKFAGEAESDLERADLQVTIAKASLAVIETQRKQAESRGLVTKSIAEEIAKATAAYDRRAFPEVLSFVMSAADRLEETGEMYRRSTEAIDSAQRQAKEAIELGGEAADAGRLIDSARAFAEAGEYAEAGRRAREASEMARWAVERINAGSVGDARALIDAVRAVAPEERLDDAEGALGEAQAKLAARDWKGAGERIDAAARLARAAADRLFDSRGAELEAAYGSVPPDATERAAREEAMVRMRAEKGRGDLKSALAAISDELTRLRDARHATLARRLAECKERMWVGEKLGVDTTPVMEIFTEAKLALEAGRAESVEAQVAKAESELNRLVHGRLDERLRQVRTEVTFAQDGLRVSLGGLPNSLDEVARLTGEGAHVRAAQKLLEAEDELNRRKSQHRELMNLHYLIDAALGRAGERHLAADDARKLLDESIQLRSSDYPAALEKARAALASVQQLLKGTEPAAGFWPFRRPGSPG